MKKDKSNKISRRTFLAGAGAVLLSGLLSKYALSNKAVEANEVEEDNIQITLGFSVDDEKGGQKIPMGSIINHFIDGTTMVYDVNNSLILKTSDANANLVTVPGGLQKANHIYYVPSNTKFIHSDNVLKCYKDNNLILTVIDREDYKTDKADRKRAKMSIPTCGGYVEYAKETLKQLDYFLANWTCPASPYSNDSDIVNYLFPAIQPYHGTSILQPVLQWNQENGGEGKWTGSCWYVYYSGLGHVVSAFFDVSVGDSITAYMSNTTSDTWYVDFRDNTTSTSVGYTFTDTSIYTEPMIGNTLLCALEAYNNNSYSYPLYNDDMPGDTTFSNITIQLDGEDVDIDWDGTVENKWYFSSLTGRSVTISGSSTVTLNTAN